MKHYIFLCLALFIGCSTPPAHSPHRLRLSFNSSPETLDPRKCGDFASATVICMIDEGLTKCTTDGSVEMALAERVEISKDQKTYTFFLRDTYWSDGTSITANDFAASWRTILDPAFPCPCRYLLYAIKNGEKCAKGECSPDEVGIRTLDDKILQIELEKPTPYFLSLTAFPLLFPQGPSGATCGPFRIEKMAAHAEIILKQNPLYWNRDALKLEEIQISIVPDEMTALSMFEQGELDWIGGPFSLLPLDAIESLEHAKELHFIPSAATSFCTFNTTCFPFSNANLRKAFAAAIDREEIVKQITGHQLPATRFIPPSLVGHENKNLLPYSPDLARKYFELALEELGITARELESLTLYYRPGQLETRLALVMQKQWKDVLGCSVGLQQLDHKSHMVKLQKREYEVAIAHWIAQFGDPVNILERFKDKANGKNYPGWENTTYMALLEQASQTLDPRERLGLLEQAEQVLAEQMPLTALYHWQSPVLCNPRIKSIVSTPCGGILFERFEFGD